MSKGVKIELLKFGQSTDYKGHVDTQSKTFLPIALSLLEIG